MTWLPITLQSKCFLFIQSSIGGVYISRKQGTMLPAIYFHFDSSRFALHTHKKRLYLHMKQKMLLVPDTSHCLVTAAFFPTFFLLCVFELDFDVSLQRVPGNVKSADFRADWPEFSWLMAWPHSSSQSFRPTTWNYCTTSDSCLCCRFSHFLNILKP